MLNQMILVGRLVSNPNVVEVGGEPIVETTIAIPRPYKNEEGVYETDLIPVTLKGGIATNTAEYCKKGDLVGVKGRLECMPEAVGDIKLSVVAEKVTFLSSKSNEN